MKKLIMFSLLMYSIALGAQDLPVIDLNSPLKKIGNYTVSSLGESFTYIPLETSSKCPVGLVKDIHISDEWLFIRDTDKVLKFDKNGKFVCKIGREGKGPGEYNSIGASAFNDTDQVMWIYDIYGKRILEYDYNGKHRNTFATQRSLDCIGFNDAGEALIIYMDLIRSSNPENYVIAELVSPGMITISVFNSPFNHNADTGGTIMLAAEKIHNNRGLYFFLTRDNRVLQLKNGKLAPILSIDYEKYRMPFEEYNVTAFMQKKLGGEYLYLKDVIIWNEKAFLSYQFQRKDYYSLEGLQGNSDKEHFRQTNGLFDDIDGGPSFWPYDVHDKLLFDFVIPVEIEYLDTWNTKTGLNIDEADNPVIRILN